MYFRLKAFRESKRLFQSDMADILQITQSSISRMEMRPAFKLAPNQLQLLYAHFPAADVDEYLLDDLNNGIVISNNTNEGGGTQNNGVIDVNSTAMEIIKQQTRAISMLAEKQTEVNDRLITLLDKLSKNITNNGEENN